MLYLREGFFCDYHGDLITDMCDYKIRKTLIKDEFDNNMIFNRKLFQIEADKLGFKLIRQQGSHMFYKHPDGRTTVIPNHQGEEVDRSLLNKIIKKDLELTKEEFLKHLK